MSENAESPEVSLSTFEPPAEDLLLLNKFHEELFKQSDRLDELAKQLFTLELAIPGLYVTALQLVAGKEATLPLSWPLLLMFVFWLFALMLTMVALFPLRYQVNTEVLRCETDEVTAPFRQTVWRWIGQTPIICPSIESFYQRNANDKRRALMLSGLCFFIGIVCAALVITIGG